MAREDALGTNDKPSARWNDDGVNTLDAQSLPTSRISTYIHTDRPESNTFLNTTSTLRFDAKRGTDERLPVPALVLQLGAIGVFRPRPANVVPRQSHLV